MNKAPRGERLLHIFLELRSGGMVVRSKLASKYGVSERTITRDLDTIRNALHDWAAEKGYIGFVRYDWVEKAYVLDDTQKLMLDDSEVLAICKILIDSRAFTKEQMTGIIERLIQNCVPKLSQEYVTDLIKNEEYHYIELSHKSEFLSNLWDIGQAIRLHKYMEITYMRPDKDEPTIRRVKPMAIMFNEFYFYMAAFIEDEKLEELYDLRHSLPTIYRIDRIHKLKTIDEEYQILNMTPFEEGEFRKRMQFMYGGKLQKIRFEYTGVTPEPILDRLPTAEVIGERNGAYIMEAEVYGDGFKMWFNSHGDRIKNISIENLS